MFYFWIRWKWLRRFKWIGRKFACWISFNVSANGKRGIWVPELWRFIWIEVTTLRSTGLKAHCLSIDVEWSDDWIRPYRFNPLLLNLQLVQIVDNSTYWMFRLWITFIWLVTVALWHQFRIDPLVHFSHHELNSWHWLNSVWKRVSRGSISDVWLLIDHWNWKWVEMSHRQRRGAHFGRRLQLRTSTTRLIAKLSEAKQPPINSLLLNVANCVGVDVAIANHRIALQHGTTQRRRRCRNRTEFKRVWSEAKKIYWCLCLHL